MKTDTVTLAVIANNAYIHREEGKWLEEDARPVPWPDGGYEIIEHVNNRINGYQGTVYLHRESEQVIVAHRGTDQLARDGGLTDVGMVVLRANLQARDAIELTRSAMEFSAQLRSRNSDVPDVLVTGHSLGGALAQLTAHRFDLRGETFNAYGAATLSNRIPEGGSSVINHAMATDPVAAASPHFGEVRLYARPSDIKLLALSGYGRDGMVRHVPEPGLAKPVRTALASLEAHGLEGFLRIGSVLADSNGLELAAAHRDMIDDYRSDVLKIRQGATFLSRGGLGAAIDLVNELRGPMPAGQPALDAAMPAPLPALVPVRPLPPLPSLQPAPPLSLRDPDHVGNTLYRDALRCVHALDRSMNRTPDHFSEQLAGSLAARMHAKGGQRIDHVVLSEDRANAFAVQGALNDPAHLRAVMPTEQAVTASLEESSRAIEAQASAQGVVQQAGGVEQVQERGRGMAG